MTVPVTMPLTLTAGDLTLGPVSMAHFEAFAAFVQTDHSAFLGGPGDRRDAWESVATHAGQWALRGYGTYWVTRGDTPVGRVGIWHPDWLSEPELSWVVYGGFARQGLATRAAATVRDAWNAAGHAPLMSLIDPANVGSVGVACRLGAVAEGDHSYASGRTVTRWRHGRGAA